MSIIPSSMCLAATAMTSIAQQSVARAASKKKGIPEVSVPEPQPSTSAGPAPGTSADVPMDPFEGLPPAKNKTGKATKGQRIKGRAKVKETARKKRIFPATYTNLISAPCSSVARSPTTRRQGSSKRRCRKPKR